MVAEVTQFRHVCFISYRNLDDNLYRYTVDRIYEDLDGELSFQRNLPTKPVFQDRKETRAGDMYNEVIAKRLCRSAVMVLIYIPRYFESKYCRREYRAMQQLEQERLQYLNPEQRDCGLIFPIILREDEEMPPSLKRRQHVNLQLLSKRGYSQSKIREFAKDIHTQYRNLTEQLPQSIFDKCDSFRLPEDLDPDAKVKVPFPRR
jgi:hypothetical protein